LTAVCQGNTAIQNKLEETFKIGLWLQALISNRR
jgi:hypothetical protein